MRFEIKEINQQVIKVQKNTKGIREINKSLELFFYFFL